MLPALSFAFVAFELRFLEMGLLPVLSFACAVFELRIIRFLCSLGELRFIC